MANSSTPNESLNQTDTKIAQNPLKPTFDFKIIDVEDIKAEAEKQEQSFEPVKHNEILNKLLSQIPKVNFREIAELEDPEDKLTQRHFLVSCIEEILRIAQHNDWGLCKRNAFIYVYNGTYWDLLDVEDVKAFLGKAAEKMGIDKFNSRYYEFKDKLFKQFIAAASLPTPEPPKNTVLINLKNGTFEITPETQRLREFNRNDFLTYQLPFEYNQNAKSPIFNKYLDEVQSEKDNQKILAEFMGSAFIKTSTLKLEKALMPYGLGANGKSVLFDVMSAMYGGDANVSNYSLQSLTDNTGYYRAKLSNKLINYTSEISSKLQTSIFKQLVSGEPVEARLPYGEPFMIRDYAKLVFNCNELPKDVEHTNAYFRRFLIIPFTITIEPEKQDEGLARKIIASELSGVFNWVLEGLRRLLDKRRFTESESVKAQLEAYKKQSDSVRMFLDDENYIKDVQAEIPLKELFYCYKAYCSDSGFRFCSQRTFSDRLKDIGFESERKSYGKAVFAKKIDVF